MYEIFSHPRNTNIEVNIKNNFLKFPNIQENVNYCSKMRLRGNKISIFFPSQKETFLRG